MRLISLGFIESNEFSHDQTGYFAARQIAGYLLSEELVLNMVKVGTNKTDRVRAFEKLQMQMRELALEVTLVS